MSRKKRSYEKRKCMPSIPKDVRRNSYNSGAPEKKTISSACQIQEEMKPKAEATQTYMDTVKPVASVSIIAVAIGLVSYVFPPAISLSILSALFLFLVSAAIAVLIRGLGVLRLHAGLIGGNDSRGGNENEEDK